MTETEAFQQRITDLIAENSKLKQSRDGILKKLQIRENQMKGYQKAVLDFARGNSGRS